MSEFSYIVLFFGILFILSFLLQVFIFRKKLKNGQADIGKLQGILVDQQNSARLLIRRDLELQRANEKLRELDLTKSNFISIAAHQLRTPLSGVKWTLNMVLKETLGQIGTEQKSFLMKCYESNERMIVLINDMLNADRIDSNKIKYNFLPIQISDLMDDVLFEMTAFISKKKLHMSYAHKGSVFPKVLIDKEKIRGVLQNLLENSIRYTLEEGYVEIDFKEVDQFLRVSIKDSGIGIPEEEQKNIFNRFFRAKNAFKTETDGSGLGLYIAKGVVEKHGGKIWFESREGEGSTFYFTIPIA
ncbi:MAG: HAMP domain-containing histidine kinase [Candidatus Zambryskibacteria bacterium]|nr:HAMP domain-containing histidine kinase [Candidatus Zambryskibacteria bacterium]